MATYKHLRSSTANKRPTTSIADGQLAINSNAASAGLFFKDSTGATIIKVGPVHVGTTAPNATPGAGGSSGNSTGEVWLDTSLTPVGVKIWNGSAWVNGTPIGSTTVQGLLELATDVETQAGSDTARAVTPASLQSKVSDSTSTTSSTTIASSTAVKSAFDLANAALPKSGGTVTGNLEIGTAGSLTFEGSVADGFETTIAVTNPTADRTITLPDQTGNMLVSGNASIVNADVNASAAIAGTKISPDFGSQTVQTTGIFSHALGSAAAPTITFTGDTNTGIYSPGADQLAISTNGTGRLFVDASGGISLNSALKTFDAGGTGSAIHMPSASIYNFDNNSGNYQTWLLNNAYRDNTGNFRYVKTAAAQYQGFSFNGDTIWHSAASGTAGNAVTFNERLRLTSDGRLGLGTSSPSYLLDVNGTIGAGTAGGVAIQLANGAAIRNSAAAANTIYFDTSFGSATHGSFEFRSSNAGTTRMLIDSSGRLGLGTSAPQGLLHVEGVTGNAPVRIVGSSGNSSALALYNNAATTNRFVVGQGFGSGSDNVAFIQNDANAAMVFGTNATERLRITAGGAVGIGSNGPSSLLHLAAASGTVQMQFNNGGTSSYIGHDSAYTGLDIAAGGGIRFRYFNGAAFAEGGRFDTSGRFLVGTSTAYGTAFTQIQGSSSNTTDPGSIFLRRGYTSTEIAGFLGTELGLIDFGSKDGGVGARISSASDGTWSSTSDCPSRLVFSTTSDSASSPTERLRITSDAYVRLASGTGGIQFNGDTAAANALDDYEEGTFTPVVVGGTTAGTATYSTQVGRYTKIGRTVTVEVQLNWTGGTGAGNLAIEGLPFNPAAYTPLTVGILSNLALTASNYVFAYANAGSGTVALQQTPVGGGSRSAITYDASAEIAIAGTYTV
jgi:hypothetical protein